MITLWHKALVVLLVGVMVSLGCVSRAHAADSLTYKGITITPAIVNLDLKSGQSRASFDIHVTNNTTTSQALTVSSIDFKSLNQTGGLAFIGSNPSQINHPNGLASWLDITPPSLRLAPSETKTVSLTVENRSDLSPGGHYAAVLFRSTQPNPSGGMNQVAINQVVSSLIFVRKVDGAQYGLTLQSSSAPRNWFRLPKTVNVVLQNSGNTQEIPRGIVTIQTPFSREVSRGIINADSSLILPGSSRLFQTAVFGTAHAWWPGIYHVQVSYRYDGSSTSQQMSTSFLYLNPVFVGVVLAIILAGWYLFRRRKIVYRQLRKIPLRHRK